ncbi:MAG: hypothetical protein A2X86_03905 [Bdellovibrionales bacterium GWA2_49_15]|nr:MAG: hypothetical protein A2X86_03905 [Bdellovibrionales bacterium GWA2_49_15]HAZ12361.1 hypothetical protein [Bdellovibrionales bacterium]
MKVSGPWLALLSAALFGVSPTLIKMGLGEFSPLLVAGLLYLGSGLGLFLVQLFRRAEVLNEYRALSSAHRLKLILAIIAGGIGAPLCLTYGIQLAPAFLVCLLLNLESVATTVIAAIFFHEHVGRRVWFGKALLVVGGIFITFRFEGVFVLSMPALLIVAACILWGIDNNLTRDVDQLSPTTFAATKGLAAGIFNILLAVGVGQGAINVGNAIGVLVIGAFSYGVSLILFIQSLRLIGASRAGTYFASGPFLGMLFSLILLGEHPPAYHWIAGVIMLLGVWLLYKEEHDHTHTHSPMTHRHAHNHRDEHHKHFHDQADEREHDHAHEHETLTHSHGHWPDIHHRHKH